jgi:vacuolar-type H+-ATPase subunit B/Vma2
LDQREHYNEINTLIGTVAKALQIDDKVAAAEIERGSIALALGEDERGRFIEATRDERMVRVYQGAVLYTAGSEPPNGV